MLSSLGNVKVDILDKKKKYCAVQAYLKVWL